MTWDVVGDLSLEQIYSIFSGVGLGIILIIGLTIHFITKCVCKHIWIQNVKDHLEEAARVEVCDRDMEIKRLQTENERLEAYCAETTWILKAATVASHKTSEILGQIKATLKDFKAVKESTKKLPLKEKVK